MDDAYPDSASAQHGDTKPCALGSAAMAALHNLATRLDDELGQTAARSGFRSGERGLPNDNHGYATLETIRRR